MHLFGRTKELVLIAPPGLAEIITLQLRYSETRLMYKIKLIEWRPAESYTVFENNLITVTTIPMDHGVPCSGFLFKEKEKKRRIHRDVFAELKLSSLDIARLKSGEDLKDADGNVTHKNSDLTLDPMPQFSYAYCSDTKYKPEIVKYIEGADLLYHESTFADDMEGRAHNTFHSTAKEAAEIAKQANVKKLILGHFSTRYRELDVLLEEAKSVFENAELAIEGTKFEVNGKQ